jgi:hypothetical protein
MPRVKCVSKTARHRSLDPVERLHITCPISIKARFLDWHDETGGNMSRVVYEYLDAFLKEQGYL